MRALLLWCLLSVAAFAVEVTVDRQSVYLGESIQLNITHQGADDIDLTPLEHDFNVVYRGFSQSRRLTNQGLSVEQVVTLGIEPKREGLLEIPSLRVDGKDTAPIAITVRTDEELQQAFRLTLDVDRDEVYLNQQVMLRVRLYHARPLDGGSLADPQVDSGVLRKIGADVNSTAVIDGVEYSVIERRYSLITDKVGPLAVEGVSARLRVSAQSRRGFRAGRDVLLEAEPKTINVLPIPSGAGGWWLPASDLTLEELSATPDVMQVGDQWARKIRIRAKGAQGVQLPPLEIGAVNGVKLYPSPGESRVQLDDDGVIGLREDTWSVVVTQPGSIELPEITVRWWNVDRNQWQISRLPPVTLAVEGEPSTEVLPVVEPMRVEQDQSSEAAVLASFDIGGVLRWLGAVVLVAAMLGVVSIAINRYLNRPERRWHQLLAGDRERQMKLYQILSALPQCEQTKPWMALFGAYLYAEPRQSLTELKESAPAVFKAFIRARNSKKPSNSSEQLPLL
ncbi:MAG: BatD family protein [Gammaproteobacteria bacterium]|nr:BatD family protein [Gammaproteobacteria bacterium]